MATSSLRLLLALMACWISGCKPHVSPPAEVEESPPTRLEIWQAIQPQAERYQISPTFIYALVAAESNFDSRAKNGPACGLMQLTPTAWRAVSPAPFEPNVWRWRANLETGIDYLAYSRSYLHRKTAFSYPLLLGAFHYGLGYVEERKFDVRRIPVPDNPIYQELWAGNFSPIEVPSPSDGNKSAQHP